MVEKEGQALSVSGEVREEFAVASGSPLLGPLRERGSSDRPGHVSRGQRSPRAPSRSLERSHSRNALEGWSEEGPEFKGVTQPGSGTQT